MGSRICGLMTALILVVGVDGVAHARAKNPQEPVVVESLAYAGGGCPDGSVAVIVSPDEQAVNLLFDQFLAQVGAGIPFSEAGATCLITIGLQAPEGKVAAALHADLRGFVDLEPGVIATVGAELRSEEDLLASFATDFVGPVTREYRLELESSVKGLAWSDCDGSATLRLALTLTLRNSSSLPAAAIATFDSVDGVVAQGGKGKLKFKISSKHCP